MSYTELLASPTIRKRVKEIFVRFGTVPETYWDIAFAVSILAFIGIQLSMTPHYQESTQTLPLIIGMPTFGFLLLVVVLKLAKITDLRQIPGLQSLGEYLDGDERPNSDTSADQLETRKRLAISTLWVLSFFGLVMVAGFVIAVPVFLLVFYRFFAEQSWLRTVLYSAIILVFIVIIFKFALNTQLYSGIFNIEAPF